MTTEKPPPSQRPSPRIRRGVPPLTIQEICLIPCHSHLTPNNTNLPAPLKFRAKVIDLNKFRGGDGLFINLTGYEVGVTLGEKKASLKPGQTGIIATGDFEGRRNATVSYHYREEGKKAWNLISSSTTMLLSDRREILVFSYDKQIGQIDYHGISFADVD